MWLNLILPGNDNGDDWCSMIFLISSYVLCRICSPLGNWAGGSTQDVHCRRKSATAEKKYEMQGIMLRAVSNPHQEPWTTVTFSKSKRSVKMILRYRSFLVFGQKIRNFGHFAVKICQRNGTRIWSSPNHAKCSVITGLPNKACPRLRDLATAPARGITQPRTYLIREPCIWNTSISGVKSSWTSLYNLIFDQGRS